MNIDIKFIDEKTVKINASLKWWSTRPPPHLKEMRTEADVIKEFNKKHPSYNVKSTEGPDRIYNCKKEELSCGEWTLKVSQKQKGAPTKKRPVSITTPKKGA